MPPVDKKLIGSDQPIELDDMRRMDVLMHLGKLVAAGLTANGIIVLHSHPGGGICIANPTKVYLDVGALQLDGEEAPEFKWLRPIVGSERPTYVSWRNGELWEVELIDSRETKDGTERETGEG